MINTRSFAADEIKWAVDVADPKATRAAAKAGLIYRFYEDREAAEAFAAKMVAEGYDAIVVLAKKMPSLRCGYCQQILTRSDAYVLPEWQRGTVPANEDPLVCVRDSRRLVGRNPEGSDKLVVWANRRQL